MLPKEIKSLWIDTSQETNYPELKAEKKADVAVVGGGLAGICIGYFLSLEGLKVTVLEASKIGSKTSGNTTAKITSLHDLKYNFLIKYFGKEKAQMYANSHQWAIREYERIIAEEKIDCDFLKVPAFCYAVTDKGAENIKKEVRSAISLGLPAKFKKKEPTIPFNHKGAIVFDNQAYFHPKKFINALAERITKNKGRIYENSKVIKFIAGDKIKLITKNGSVSAKKVVIATNYPVYDKDRIFLKMNQIRSYALAAKSSKRFSPGMYISIDGSRLSFRPHKSKNSKWLIISGQDHITGENGKDYYLNLEQEAKENFQANKFEYKWVAQDSFPIDRVPFISRMKTPGFFVATGFGEWGMTSSIVSAKILTDLINGNSNEWEELYSLSRTNPPSLQKLGKLGKNVIKGYSDRIIKIGKFSPSKLIAGKGKIFSHQGKKIAVYKDENGKIYALSAVCTHMGCVVRWNSNEKSWDCPCHGSRFDIMGRVLDNPAISNLKRIKLDNI